jgi:anti-sigma factor RsiW
MPRKSCPHPIAWQLSAKADGRLTTDEAAALEQQLASCDVCREGASQLAWVAEGLKRGRELPPRFADKVLRRVAQVELPQSAAAGPARARLRWLPAAAFAVGLGLIVFSLGRSFRPAPVPPPQLEVELKLAGAKARTVAVAGDFNGWDAVAMRRGEDGVWRIRLSLPPGRYQYAFVVDREKWVPDPQAATMVESGYGGANSVLDLSL